MIYNPTLEADLFNFLSELVDFFVRGVAEKQRSVLIGAYPYNFLNFLFLSSPAWSKS